MSVSLTLERSVATLSGFAPAREDDAAVHRDIDRLSGARVRLEAGRARPVRFGRPRASWLFVRPSVWECSRDLAQYVLSDQALDWPTARVAQHESEGRRDVADPARAPSGACSLRGCGSVLELGCGHALPALASLQRGATQLTLHDASATILQHVPAPLHRQERP